MCTASGTPRPASDVAAEWVAGLRAGDPRAVQAADRLLARMSKIAQADTLTERQVELLELAAQGLTRREIGARVYLSPETVKDHMAQIRLRLGARNIPHAVALAFRQGILS